jgi:ribose 5-phosphate isomerase B
VRIAVAFDHAGVPFTEVVTDAIRAAGHEVADLGTCDDYPDAAELAGRAIHQGDAQRAVVVCGSGAGIAVAATKLPGIRAAVGHDTYTAAQCVTHDDCNVLCVGSRVIGPVYAAACITAFVTAEFSGEERHVRRLHKIDLLEQRGFDAPLPTPDQRGT